MNNVFCEALALAVLWIKTRSDENWEAKLSGFVFSIKQLVSRKEQAVLCEPVATIGYVDPAIEKIGGASSKSDIYSFGVVLFEILCGRSACIENEAKRFLAPLAKYHYENNTLEDIIHPNLCNQIFARSLLKYTNIAYSCLNEEPAHRPNMAYVVVKLEKAMELQLRGENLWKNSKHLKIQLNDIIIATNNFSHIYRTEIGDFNSWYKADLDRFNNENPPFVDEKCKGELLKTHNTVIIKRFYPKDEEEEDLALREIEMLAIVKHPNIVTLIGYCVEGSEIIRVIENASNGYLSDYLESKCFFNWEKRLKICVDVAKALNYLHFEMEDQKAMVHGDIRIYNIRLFENWRAKIDEFEEAVLLPVNQEHEARHKDATIYNNFYTDPEYMNTGKYKRELDVYSFGVLLFEMLCGRIANDPTYMKESDIGLVHVVRQSFCMKTLEDMIDPIIKEGTVDDNFVLHKGPNKDSLNTFIEIAYQCVATTQDQRPTMKVVLKELEKALFLQENIENLKLSLEDVKLATQNFHDDNCIGRGSFGKVYTGKVAQGDGFNTIVAMRFDARLGQGVQQFVTELQMLLEYKHDNIIRLVGYCDEMNDKVIVYESLSKSLDRHLNDVSLTWKKRLNICIDVASALDFLHGGVGREAKVVIHKDIKSANILFNDSWKAKLASFGPFLISPINQEPGYDVCGTPGYLDPMYIGSGFLSKESDIYSFGVVLFEILCGRSTLAFHQHEGCYLEDYIKNNFGEGKQEEVVFEQIKEQIVPESLVNFQTIAYQCLHHEREKRPTAKKVLIQLKKALELQEKGVQDLNTDEDVNKLEKLQLTPEIHGMNLEHLKIHLSEIESATQYFSEIHKIAHFDCIWYRAELDHPKGRGTVVIKQYPTLYVYGEEEFFTEIKVLTNVQHPNIITLLGFCDEGSEMILVTENVSNGYLFNYLGNVDAMSVLTWEKRLQICIDVAHALNYLHYEIEDQTVIINRDIASSNIGLDENWSAKILEFGVSVFLPPNQEDEGIYLECRYRPTYVDPEIETIIRYKRESDIYSFGVVMFELLCGRKADDPIYMKKNERGLAPLARHSIYMGTLEDMIDPILKEETSENNFFLNRGLNKDSLRTFIEIAYQCVAETQNQRPTIKAVIQELEKALLLEKTNKDNPKVPLGYVKLATQDFHYDNCIGIGGFGKVYKGCVQVGDEFNTIVAKRLDTRFGQGEIKAILD
ncbi:hypothetical protein QVD17_37322 [Tagetes erecta]|uniref:Protein kinase domain-containing protein n=1 Tax=Tagetes erecta TaxID=13708 RepID=A0AAD8JVR8_TARER|nr:hypothetical protein QVD17_37322 [Tagetes erecta]